jgi:hypothetical protein
MIAGLGPATLEVLKFCILFVGLLAVFQVGFSLDLQVGSTDDQVVNTFSWWHNLEALPILGEFQVLLVLVVEKEIALGEFGFDLDCAVPQVA